MFETGEIKINPRARFANSRKFYCLDCKKIFRVRPEEYAIAKSNYAEICAKIDYQAQHCSFAPNYPPFELKGHIRWIYRDDEDYSQIDGE